MTETFIIHIIYSVVGIGSTIAMSPVVPLLLAAVAIALFCKNLYDSIKDQEFSKEGVILSAIVHCFGTGVSLVSYMMQLMVLLTGATLLNSVYPLLISLCWAAVVVMTIKDLVLAMQSYLKDRTQSDKLYFEIIPHAISLPFLVLLAVIPALITLGVVPIALAPLPITCFFVYVACQAVVYHVTLQNLWSEFRSSEFGIFLIEQFPGHVKEIALEQPMRLVEDVTAASLVILVPTTVMCAFAGVAAAPALGIFTVLLCAATFFYNEFDPASRGGEMWQDVTYTINVLNTKVEALSKWVEAKANSFSQWAGRDSQSCSDTDHPDQRHQDGTYSAPAFDAPPPPGYTAVTTAHNSTAPSSSDNAAVNPDPLSSADSPKPQ